MQLGVEMKRSARERPEAEPPLVHLPVQAEEVVQYLGGDDPAGLEGWIVDLTAGAGGHSLRLLDALPRIRLLALDQDPFVLVHARRTLEAHGDRARVRRARMSAVGEVLHAEGIGRVVGFLMDLGASSLQLDSTERGFSFQHDARLDMRMDPDRRRTAADIVNGWDEGDLADLFYYEGGETRARRIARAIVAARRNAPFLRTMALADLVERTVGRRGRIHPATRVFQSLRRATNEEADELDAALEAADRWLVDGGRLAALAFHSGEGGALKRFFANGVDQGRWRMVTRKPLKPRREEVLANPRARSASLRVAERVRMGARPAGPMEPPEHRRRSR
jgi:16S rRNA (cytosine1402-N4)-methyltransferase